MINALITSAATVWGCLRTAPGAAGGLPHPTRGSAIQLPPERDWNSSEDYRAVGILLVPSRAQRTALLAYFRRALTGMDDEDTLRLVHREAFRFLSDIHRLCVLLAREPIEVSAGPTEERQRTEADVINEVERELQQLGTGEAFHALLQEDGTIKADKITLLPPPPLPPGDPALIAKIRSVSRQRFSRPRAEIDAKTARRLGGTPPAATSTAAPKLPGTGTRKPPPGLGPPPRQPRPQPPPDPPIGRRS